MLNKDQRVVGNLKNDLLDKIFHFATSLYTKKHW